MTVVINVLAVIGGLCAAAALAFLGVLVWGILAGAEDDIDVLPGLFDRDDFDRDDHERIPTLSDEDRDADLAEAEAIWDTSERSTP